MTRILHLLASPVWSGPAELICAIARAQREAGCEVWVAVDRKRTHLGSEEPAAPRLKEAGLLDEGGLELSVKSGPAAVLRDVRALRLRKVDVLHAHFSHDHLLARFGRPQGTLLVRSIHAPRSVRWSLPRADAYTVPYEALLPALGDLCAAVLPPPIEPRFVPAEDRQALRARLGLEGSPLLGMASTFQASRRHPTALDAFALLRAQRPSARLLLMGDGVEEEALRERAARPDLRGAVLFAGYLSGEAYLSHLQALDELWVLGLGNDWGGRVASQARACGVRVVAVDEGGLSRSADVVVKAADPAAVCEASLSGVRVDRPVARPAEVAAALFELYGRARG